MEENGKRLLNTQANLIHHDETVVLFLKAVKSISKRLDFQLENPEFLGDDEEEVNEPEQPHNILSVKLFMQKYCSKKVLQTVQEATGFQAEIPRNRISFRFENGSTDTNRIPRNEHIIYEDDHLTVTTDESELTTAEVS